jgi:hypothetical protein
MKNDGILLTVRHRLFFVTFVEFNNVLEAVDGGLCECVDKVGYRQVLEFPDYRDLATRQTNEAH